MIDTFIYVIYCENAGSMKVGYSNNPSKRLVSMQTGCPHRLNLVSTFIATHTDEQELHHLLQTYRLSGEWFLCCLESMEIITKFQSARLSTNLSLAADPRRQLKEFIKSQCCEYLADNKTRRRTRVPLKFVRSCCSEVDATITDIRTIMAELDYTEYKDANKSVYFSKPKQDI